LQRCQVLICRAFEIHRKEHGPNNYPGDARGNILRDLQTSLVRQFLNLSVIGLDFRGDHRAVADLIMWLDCCDRRGIAASARGAQHASKRNDGETHWHLPQSDRLRAVRWYESMAQSRVAGIFHRPLLFFSNFKMVPTAMLVRQRFRMAAFLRTGV
jgi:hypothetical protein